MGNFFFIAALVLFVVSIYVLSRGYGWSRLLSLIVAVATVAGPLTVGLLQFVIPLPPIVAKTFGGIAIVVPFLVLFALCKSVVARNSMHANASR